jgi:hypothetical protein
MKKNILILIMVTTGFISCGQPSKSRPEVVDIETVNSERKYEYTDSDGKSVIIQTKGPRGIVYNDLSGKKDFKVLFWTLITNETDKPLELKIDFPIEYEVPTLIGKYFKILLPSDTMTLDKDPLQDYGMKDLKSFIDNNIHKPSSLRRTINPKESSGFYIAILFDKGVYGSSRTGLSIKGQDLIYKVSRYEGKVGHPLVFEKEINCGSINLKGLVRKK